MALVWEGAADGQEGKLNVFSCGLTVYLLHQPKRWSPAYSLTKDVPSNCECYRSFFVLIWLFFLTD